MRSIRLSLVLYFLALLGVALFAVSTLVYGTVYQSQRAKKETTAAVIEAQYLESCRKEQAKLDESLLYQAKTLARLAQFRLHRVPDRRQLAGFGPLTSATIPGGYANTVLWLAQASYSRFSLELDRRQITRIKFDEKELLRSVDSGVAEYFQIKNPLGPGYRSTSLGERSLPDVPEGRVLEWEFDDVTLEPGEQVRRVTLAAPAVRQMPWWAAPPPPQPRTDRGRGWERGGGPKQPDPAEKNPPNPGARGGGVPPVERQQPTLIIQCACDTARLEATLAEFRTVRDEDLARLDEATAASLLELRNRLLLIAGVCFVAAMAGGFCLVRLGLAPLARLSDAVSRVSPKDFRLPLDRARLPVELRPIAERLDETLDTLKRVFAREKQAAADISHELRTPLASLLTATEVVLKKPRAPEEYREVLEDCRASGQQMSRLVERLLALARLDAGVDTLRPRELDVAVLAEQCTALVRPLAEARGLQLEIQTHGPTPYTADPDKLGEVLTNLLYNAIEYNRPEGRVEVAVSRENGHLTMEVRDTGIGITAEAKEHLFERFYRADPSRNSDDLHAGLGLAIVKGYVDLMGGTIDVESEPGKGSTFRVSLPVREATRE
jgi:heavy metal sensor kinase